MGLEVPSAYLALTDGWSMVRRLQLNAQMQQRLIFLFRMRFELSGILCRQNMLSRFGTLVSGCAFWE